MAEKGSDQMLADAGITDVDQLVHEEEQRQAEEEERLRTIENPPDDPGEDHPQPDEAPPADEAHDEYDSLPPPG